MINRVWRAILLFQQELIYLNDFRLESCMPEQKCKINVSGRDVWVVQKQKSQTHF